MGDQYTNVAIVRRSFPIRDYDLDATLDSGQAFRWQTVGTSWVGVIGQRWVRLQAEQNQILAETVAPVEDWTWLKTYLQLDLDLEQVLQTFPTDPSMQAAVTACRGLRLLRQDPWECLASFICSSTKQIVQIRQIIALLSGRFGEPLSCPDSHGPAWSFPTAERLAQATEAELLACKLGFRAKYLRAAAQRVAAGDLDLSRLGALRLESAREQLLELPGVGRKIADCVLLFAYGFPGAFPVDVWISRALRQLYFPRRRVTLRRLHEFSASHFGPQGGFAQQYLFHFVRRFPQAGGACRARSSRGKKHPRRVLGS
ncbi:MAG TPA: DNA glycosylase [Verrucomicrobiae bacterium]|nr:DNA glycosylase [Verrucomicrobiae bacterium]